MRRSPRSPTTTDSTGRRWLYWKNDGNAIGVDTWIYVSELSADGLALVGPVHRMIKQDLPWEGDLVEAPYMVERNGKFDSVPEGRSEAAG